MDGPYAILGIERGCSDAELRTAWKRLSMKHHPDRHGSDEAKAEATERFARISEAYNSIVRDREAGRPRAFKPPPVCIEVLATLEDAFVGRRISVRIPLRRRCEECRDRVMVACDSCDGEGSYVLLDGGATAVHKDCGLCSGVGRVRPAGSRQCRACSDTGLRSRTIEVRLDVPPGALGPHEVRADGQGEDSHRCEERGDVVAFLQIPDSGSGFERVGADLVYTARISLERALEGGAFTFRHMDETDIAVPPLTHGVVRHCTTRMLEGLGMPSPGGPGNLLVRYEVEWPRNIDPGTRAEMVRILGQWRRKRIREPPRQNTCAVKVPGSKKPRK